jgi:hypothetical protein
MDEIDEVSAQLRAAYSSAPHEMTGSFALRQRVMQRLEAANLVQPRTHDRRANRVRVTAVAVAASLVGFVIGAQPWRSSGPVVERSTVHLVGPAGADMLTDRASDIGLVVEEVQRTAGDHARALARLVASIEEIDASELIRAQDVYLASDRANEEYARIILAGRARVPEPTERERSEGLPVVWF